MASPDRVSISDCSIDQGGVCYLVSVYLHIDFHTNHVDGEHKLGNKSS